MQSGSFFFCVFLVSSGLNEKGINLYIEEIYTYIVKNDMENKTLTKNTLIMNVN